MLKNARTTISVQVKSTGGSPTLQTRYVTPSASTQYINPQTGYDGLNQCVVYGDSDFISSNIKKRKSIFDVAGTANIESSLLNGTGTITIISNEPSTAFQFSRNLSASFPTWDGNNYLIYFAGKFQNSNGWDCGISLYWYGEFSNNYYIQLAIGNGFNYSFGYFYDNSDNCLEAVFYNRTINGGNEITSLTSSTLSFERQGASSSQLYQSPSVGTFNLNSCEILIFYL